MSDKSKDQIEYFIIRGLLSFNNYTAKFIDKLQTEYFSQDLKYTLKCIKTFYNVKNKIPNASIIEEMGLPKIKELRDNPAALELAVEALRSAMALDVTEESAYEWLVDETKSFVKKKVFMLAFSKAIAAYDQNNMEEAYKLIEESSCISFDESLGLDYMGDLSARMERARVGEDIMPSGITQLDNRIGGGWHKKSINLIMAGTNVGKTLILADLSLRLIQQGRNGLYITLEIYEDLLANRIDANLTDIALSEIRSNIDAVEKLVEAERKRASYGTFIIKEFPPNGLNCNGLRAYLRELELKKKFIPDFIVIDYIGLFAPNGKTFSDNTYGKLKTVTEEIRHLASEFKVPIFSATQANRSGLGNSHIGLENIADSTGIAFGADLIISCTRDESLDKENKMRWFINKSRFSRNGTEFYVGVDYDHQRIIDPDESGNIRYTPRTMNSPLEDDGQTMDIET